MNKGNRFQIQRLRNLPARAAVGTIFSFNIDWRLLAKPRFDILFVPSSSSMTFGPRVSVNINVVDHFLGPIIDHHFSKLLP